MIDLNSDQTCFLFTNLWIDPSTNYQVQDQGQFVIVYKRSQKLSTKTDFEKSYAGHVVVMVDIQSFQVCKILLREDTEASYLFWYFHQLKLC